eukprot:scaffold3607_cov114-Isochrysis_galbana.AAC.22
MCKALAGSGRLSEQTFCRTNLALQHRWVKWRGSLAHPVVLRWVARTFRRRGDIHDGVVRRRGRRSGARVSVSGQLLHANPKIGCFAALTTHAMSRSSGSRQAENISSALCTGSGLTTG